MRKRAPHTCLSSCSHRLLVTLCHLGASWAPRPCECLNSRSCNKQKAECQILVQLGQLCPATSSCTTDACLTMWGLESCHPWTPGTWRSCSRWCAGGCGRSSRPSPGPAATGRRPGRSCSAGRSAGSFCTTSLRLPVGRQDTGHRGWCLWFFGKSRGRLDEQRCSNTQEGVIEEN